jgi:hypothetical protein
MALGFFAEVLLTAFGVALRAAFLGLAFAFALALGLALARGDVLLRAGGLEGLGGSAEGGGGMSSMVGARPLWSGLIRSMDALLYVVELVALPPCRPGGRSAREKFAVRSG